MPGDIVCDRLAVTLKVKKSGIENTDVFKSLLGVSLTRAGHVRS